jgi:hypothetical protein
MFHAILAALLMAGLPLAEAASTPPAHAASTRRARYADAYAIPADHPEYAAQGL